MGKLNRNKPKSNPKPMREVAKGTVPEASALHPTKPKKLAEAPVAKPRRTLRAFLAAAREQILWRAAQLVMFSPLILLLSPIVYIPCYRASIKEAKFTVDRRERVTKGSGDSQRSYYLVWSREGEVFCVADTWSFFSFDSSDRYGKLREGSQVQASVAGWRVPFLSWYRNVVEIKSVAP
jgi:hypothetical protein